MVQEGSGKSETIRESTVGDHERRLRQQSLVAEFGVFALQDNTLPAILRLACEIAADGLGVRFAKVLEWREAEENFLIIAGIGWHEGVVGHGTIPGGPESAAGFAFETARPVIANHLEKESRFRTPSTMSEHGVKRAVNVLIDGNKERFGVLEADSHASGAFSDDDLNFLQSLANTLGVAIEKESSRAQILNLNRDLAESLRLKDMLTREIDHRIKNSLNVVSSMLMMQSRRSDNPEVKDALDNAANRIWTIANVHASLYADGHSEIVAFAPYLTKLTDHLSQSHGEADLAINVEADDISVASDSAVSLGILAAELITNAIKHASREGKSPHIHVLATTRDDEFLLKVSDDGNGLPDGFDPSQTSGLGMQVVRSLTKSLSGTLETPQSDRGAVFLVRMPISRLSAT